MAFKAFRNGLAIPDAPDLNLSNVTCVGDTDCFIPNDYGIGPASVSTLCDALGVKVTFNQLFCHQQSCLKPACVTQACKALGRKNTVQWQRFTETDET